VSATATRSRPTATGEEPEVPLGCRVMVVDDHEMVRVGLHTLLSAQPWVERCLGAGTPDRALELAERTRPQLALVDLFVGKESGVSLCAAILRASPNTKIVLMSGAGSVSPAVARAAGACGFVPKDWPARTLLEALERAREGRRVFPRSAEEARPRARLTPREQDVLGLLCRGLSNIEIAAELYLSRHTVKQHTCALYRKLDVGGRAEAAARAQQLGLVR